MQPVPVNVSAPAILSVLKGGNQDDHHRQPVGFMPHDSNSIPYVNSIRTRAEPFFHLCTSFEQHISSCIYRMSPYPSVVRTPVLRRMRWCPLISLPIYHWSRGVLQRYDTVWPPSLPQSAHSRHRCTSVPLHRGSHRGQRENHAHCPSWPA